ncbi:MAG TPA: hypothetical protein O0X70_03120 [Methanocorpusculum sp.]|nr:hypothetical protein [Methanocorpusculum sp.]
MKKVLVFLTLLALACVCISAGCVSSVESTTPSGEPVVEQTAASQAGSASESAGNAVSYNDLFGGSDIGKGKTTTYELKRRGIQCIKR